MHCGFKCGGEARSKASKLASATTQDKVVLDRVLASVLIG
jgi:hypothetical protein